MTSVKLATLSKVTASLLHNEKCYICGDHIVPNMSYDDLHIKKNSVNNYFPSFDELFM